MTSAIPIAPLDHLVMGTADLQKGGAWLERFLGVTLSPVGVHDAMGTHNRLLSLGPGRYLELIAINPTAIAPERPRWFGLDTAEVQDRVATRPRVIGWVVRTSDIDELTERTGQLLGAPLAMKRGDYAWQITVPSDGYPIEGGLVPHCIQWTGAHPTEALPDQHCSLEWMEAAHPNPAKVDYLLREIGAFPRLVLSPSPPYSGMTLCAYIRTPSGVKTLMS